MEGNFHAGDFITDQRDGFFSNNFYFVGSLAQQLTVSSSVEGILPPMTSLCTTIANWQAIAKISI